LLDRFKNNRRVQNAFYGLRPVVAALIASAGLGLAALTFWGDAPTGFAGPAEMLAALDWRQAVLFGALLAGLRLYKKMQPLYVIAAAGGLGILLKL
jgi:chromate transporter